MFESKPRMNKKKANQSAPKTGTNLRHSARLCHAIEVAL